MKKLFLVIAIQLCTYTFSQKENIINPKGNFYFGAETGLNAIDNYNLNEKDISIQVGFLAEYYFAKQWSLQGRIKYFKTGLSFYIPDTHSGSWFDLGHDESYGTFRGAVIAIPINLKWEFRLFKNLNANLRMGFAYNFETKSEYNYSSNLSTDFPKQYGSVNSGIGLNYFVDEKLAIYIDSESFVGGKKGNNQTIIFSKDYYSQNMIFNFGVKYNFKK